MPASQNLASKLELVITIIICFDILLALLVNSTQSPDPEIYAPQIAHLLRIFGRGLAQHSRPPGHADTPLGYTVDGATELHPTPCYSTNGCCAVLVIKAYNDPHNLRSPTWGTHDTHKTAADSRRHKRCGGVVYTGYRGPPDHHNDGSRSIMVCKLLCSRFFIGINFLNLS